MSLIDSPGIGENTEMGNVVKDFVMKNDVFGFLFTVASNRAGGVLNKVGIDWWVLMQSLIRTGNTKVNIHNTLVSLN